MFSHYKKLEGLFSAEAKYALNNEHLIFVESDSRSYCFIGNLIRKIDNKPDIIIQIFAGTFYVKDTDGRQPINQNVLGLIAEIQKLDEVTPMRKLSTNFIEQFKVTGISKNANSFGLHGVIIVAKSGTAYQLGVNTTYNKINCGDLLDCTMSAKNNLLSVAGINYEIPTKLPSMSPEDAEILFTLV